MTEFQERFVASNALGTLALAPIVDYRAPGVPGRVYLFDPARPDGGDAHHDAARERPRQVRAAVAFATLAMIR